MKAVQVVQALEGWRRCNEDFAPKTRTYNIKTSTGTLGDLVWDIDLTVGGKSSGFYSLDFGLHDLEDLVGWLCAVSAAREREEVLDP